jgi:HJR/Mrr/RecB family endonuclease
VVIQFIQQQHMEDIQQCMEDTQLDMVEYIQQHMVDIQQCMEDTQQVMEVDIQLQLDTQLVVVVVHLLVIWFLLLHKVLLKEDILQDNKICIVIVNMSISLYMLFQLQLRGRIAINKLLTVADTRISQFSRFVNTFVLNFWFSASMKFK